MQRYHASSRLRGECGFQIFQFYFFNKIAQASSSWLARHRESSRMNLYVNPALKFQDHVPGLPWIPAFVNC